MTGLWWCMNCDAARELSRHGRCSCCDSDAVTVLSLEKPVQSASVKRVDAVEQVFQELTRMGERYNERLRRERQEAEPDPRDSAEAHLSDVLDSNWRQGGSQ